MDHFTSLASVISHGGLSYDRLLNFCRIAEAGSITKAARGDDGRQSLYSRQIRELEGFFGVTLKERRGKGIVITEAGQRLAQLARAHLLGLEDFKREAVSIPKRLAIATGNSILEWVLLPRIAELRKALPDTTLEFYSERTATIVERLTDMTIDIGLIREDALVPPLKGKQIIEARYVLILPKRLARGLTEENLKGRIGQIPLATSVGGRFREILESTAAKAKWPLWIAVSCASFTQAARVLKAGNCGAVLPAFAAQDFDPVKIVTLPLPFLRGQYRNICVAWNPRLVEVRSLVERACGCIQSNLGP